MGDLHGTEHPWLCCHGGKNTATAGIVKGRMCTLTWGNPGAFICFSLRGLLTEKRTSQATTWRHLPAASGRPHCVNMLSEGEFWHSFCWWNLTFYWAPNNARLKKTQSIEETPSGRQALILTPLYKEKIFLCSTEQDSPIIWNNVPGIVIIFYSLQTPFLLCRHWVPLVSHATSSPSMCLSRWLLSH